MVNYQFRSTKVTTQSVLGLAQVILQGIWQLEGISRGDCEGRPGRARPDSWGKRNLKKARTAGNLAAQSFLDRGDLGRGAAGFD